MSKPKIVWMRALLSGAAIVAEINAVQHAAEFQRTAAAFLAAMARALSVVTFHQLDNAAVDGAVNGVFNAALPLLKVHGRAELQTVGEHVFLNREAIRLRGDAFEYALRLRRIFRRMGFNELAVQGAITQNDIRDFFRRFQVFHFSPEPRGFVHERFDRISVRWIAATVNVDPFFELSGPQNAMRSYLGVVAQMDEALTAFRRERVPRIERIRRAVHQLCDAAFEHPGLMAAFSRVDGLRGDGAGHAAATAALTALMARRLLLPRRVVAHVVMTATLHATRPELHLCAEHGPDDFAPHSGSRPSPRHQSEPDPFPLSGVGDSSNLRRQGQVKAVIDVSRGALGNDVLAWLVAAGELSESMSAGEAGLGVLARFIAVPCAFHRMVAPPKGQRPLSPDMAVAAIVDGAGVTFDPAVARLFASVVGLYPVGTTVRLNNGALAVVVGLSPRASSGGLPVVKIIQEGPHSPVDTVLDLSTMGSLTITGAIAVEEEVENPLHFLLG